MAEQQNNQNIDIMTVISMAHDTHSVLQLLGYKVQEGHEVTKDDLQSLPTVANYASYIMKALLQLTGQQQAQPQVQEVKQPQDRKPPAPRRKTSQKKAE